MSRSSPPTTPVQLHSVSPVLAVGDLTQAMEFYRAVLGFECSWAWGTPPHLASVCRDRVEITLLERPDVGPSVGRIYIRVTGIDDYHAGITARASASVVVPIGDRDYGMRDFRVVDPSGNEIDIGQPLEQR